MTMTLASDRTAASGMVAKDLQVVALHLADGTYGVDIASIHSVLTLQPITSVPNVPSFVKGVMNLRGKILPVMDLRSRFGLPPLDESKTRDSRIVIVESGALTAGLIVDSVSEVIKLPADAIEPPSSMLNSTDIRCITGIGRVENKTSAIPGKSPEVYLILLLDIDETLKSVSGAGSDSSLL